MISFSITSGDKRPFPYLIIYSWMLALRCCSTSTAEPPPLPPPPPPPSAAWSSRWRRTLPGMASIVAVNVPSAGVTISGTILRPSVPCKRANARATLFDTRSINVFRYACVPSLSWEIVPLHICSSTRSSYLGKKIEEGKRSTTVFAPPAKNGIF
jgi:hypothetical protein